MNKFIFSLIFSFSSLTFAGDFDPYNWNPGLHLFAGGGFNSAIYNNTTDTYDGGLGLNLKTDLVYFLNSDWALEWSSAVKFNRVDSYLVWDTLFTVGVRMTLPSLTFYKHGQPYGRLFVGRAPTVIFLNGDSSTITPENKDVSRIQFDGPVVGAAIGTLRSTEKGLIWFTEIGMSGQSLEQESDIKMEGDVPVVISTRSVSDHTTILSFYVTFGIMAF